ncbi:type 4a pilus biogenesis protein PilO [Chromobacterium subtsugae]|uniref:Type 4a pilus biogenesis protein PilO n=1 Tax=Chromobacterium subtsugae TaxID=251747 RepID=A0ABS7FHP9_9NEIS|nr:MULTISPECIES: type 4a pilus biogenesis protein PilO [Chromobacterium]KUM02006.1 pilus assembly protein PilO [Chromobacterium subtsugae]KZE85469.1 pilus assembly protein PilO [Chromobacterium sp. F49]MBW7567564.1 type 4a pilus biogenesis protein PilO [Chromobacterium subtsugae]MBW8288808.1 type 4a pilus biogenesis protein PilO [Chromobacterium subtsugae]OBU87058.1 pilus assembly protein PilO [Chromobacterium subtsugae]
MTLDELRGLDPKDMANWPLQAQALMLAILTLLVAGLGYFFVLGDQLDHLNQARLQEAQLKQTFVDKKRQAVNLDALQQQLREIDASFGALLKQLPTKSDMDTLLTEINQAGLGRGLQFELFKPGSESRSAEMAEVPISIRLSGSYNDLAAFVNDVAQLSRIVTISDISLNPGGGKDNRLTMDATARTYRALEPSERSGLPAAQPK